MSMFQCVYTFTLLLLLKPHIPIPISIFLPLPPSHTLFPPLSLNALTLNPKNTFSHFRYHKNHPVHTV